MRRNLEPEVRLSIDRLLRRTACTFGNSIQHLAEKSLHHLSISLYTMTNNFHDLLVDK